MDNFTSNIMMSSGKFKEEKEYWLDKLSGDFTISSFPMDFLQEELEKPEKTTIKYILPESVSKGMYEMGSNSDYAVYMILLCGIKYLLYRYTGNDDIVLGMPSFKKDNGDGSDENNVSPLRTKFQEDWSFKDLLLDIRRTVGDARKYRNIPFERLAELLDLQFDNGIFAKFKTIVLLKNIHNLPLNSGIEADMCFSFIKSDDFLELEIEYSSNLYEKNTLDKIAACIIRFYTLVTENADIKLVKLDLFSEEETRKVLFDFNDTRAEYPQNKVIQELLEEQVEKNPCKVALVFKGETLTYKELNEKANQVARKLVSKGVKADSVVGIMVERSFDMIISIIGVLKAGGAYLPIDPDYPAERIKYMLADSGAEILVTKNRFLHYVSFDKESIYIDDEEIYEADKSNLNIVNTPRNLAYVIYTSGSTGEPKGAAIEHKSVNNFIQGIINKIDFSPMSSILALTTICFDIFVLETLLPLTQGMRVVIADETDQKDPRILNELIISEEVDMLQVTPSRMQLLLNYGDRLTCLEKVKTIMVGGEVFPKGLDNSIRKLTQAKIYNMYGPIETTIWSTIKEIQPMNNINIGKPIANTRIYIMGKNKWLQTIGIPGELCIAGDGLARTYINRPELTESKFIPNPFISNDDNEFQNDRIYCTGDLAKWLPNGDIEFIGRSDYQVKIRGFRIELGEIETLFLKYEGIKDVAVVDKTATDGSKYLCAYVVVDEELNMNEIKGYLPKHLPYYMIPTHYGRLEKMPLTQNGKIDRKVLRTFDDTSARSVYAAPENELQSKLVEIWEEVLKIDKIGIDDDIEELGGNSFLAMTLELNMEVNDLDVTAGEIFQNSTIRKLAEYIESKKQNDTILEQEKTKGDLET